MQLKKAALLQTLLAAFLSMLITEAVAQSSLSGFEQALKDAGWSVQRDDAGNLILIPREASANTAPQDQWQRMQSELRAAGWNVERTADGSLILIPPAQAALSSPEAVDPMLDIKQKLEETGWVVSSSADGSMLLYPPGKTVSGKPLPVAGIPPQVQITLPVNNWQEANDIAQSWLKSQADFGASVGKIRKLFRVYVVSIVSNNKPHHLLQQIAIRSSDGSVIVLN